ncbi:MAG TPA: helix-turn-helix transcriptional regulator [Steroidobacter sp.]|uniref:helix-turn-helix domain-containing protein n=1 Tax=Steroidobacter sp. TaxID=1978227 RepID=UPI002ED89337
MTHSILPRLIGALGEPDFASVTAGELSRFLGFDLSAIVVHRRAEPPAVLFDNFDRIGCREGIRNYVGFTHKINPMLARVPTAGACRARDFAGGALTNAKDVNTHIVMEAEEELGFRTVGWPQRMEEVGLYIDAWGGVVELGFYRERARCSISTGKLRALNDLTAPLAAAFDKHAALKAAPIVASVLSPREQEICALLLKGCSSQAIALRLDISRHTVKDHRKAIFRKLNVSSLAELFAQARAA